MIDLKNLSFRYKGAKSDALEGIDLTAKMGELILITGESGCGKTTLTRILNGLCPQFFEGTVTGQYLLNGANGLEMSLDEIGLQIGNVFQDPRSQFFTTNTTDEIVMAMENQNYSLPMMQKRLEEMSELLGIECLLNRGIFNLSSGEKQKVAIAAACAIHPSFLVLDEPSANLDSASTLQLAVLLGKMKRNGLTLIVSEHRLHYLGPLIDRMIVMEKGRIRKSYSSQDAQKIPAEEMCKMGLRFFQIPPVESKQQERIVLPSISVSELSFKRQQNVILDKVSVTLSEGEIVVITGANGTGKTTFCHIISGVLKENSGQVTRKEKQLDQRARLRNSFFVGQDADYQLYASNVLEEVTLNIKHSKKLECAAETILEKLNLLDVKCRHPVSLSGGQKQRVLLAAAIMRERKLLILDEPTSGLDGRNMRIIAEILRQIARSGVSIVLITHDTEFSQLTADKVIYLKEGRLQEEHDGLFLS